MPKLFLRPKKDVLDIKGNVSYSISWRAWNTICLKKEILDQFPQLRDKGAKIGYRVIFHKTYEELITAINKIKENKEALPILLYLYQS